MLSQNVDMLNYTSAVPAEVYVQKREQSTAIAKEQSASIGSTVKWIAIAFVALAGLVYLVNGFIAQKSYEMQVLRTEVIALEKGNERARLEVAKLESPARVQSIAESRLGMHVPQQAIYGKNDVYIDQSKIKD